MTKTSTIKKNEHMPDLADENIAAVEQTVTPAGLPDSPESENQQTSLSEDSPKTDTRKTIEIQISPNMKPLSVCPTEKATLLYPAKMQQSA